MDLKSREIIEKFIEAFRDEKMEKGDSLIVFGLTDAKELKLVINGIEDPKQYMVGIYGTTGDVIHNLVTAMHAVPDLRNLLENAVHQYRMETDKDYQVYIDTIKNQ